MPSEIIRASRQCSREPKRAWRIRKKVSCDNRGVLLRRFRLDCNGREPSRQVRYLGIGQRLGDDAHDFVGALAAALGVQLLRQVDLRLPREVRGIGKYADARLAMTDGTRSCLGT